MAITEREKVIAVLQKERKTALHDNVWAFDYAISSLKTDLKYDLMYEGEEVYTKDEVITMLAELLDELKYTNLSGAWKPNYAEGFNDSVATCVKKIQCRIDKLKEDECD